MEQEAVDMTGKRPVRRERGGGRGLLLLTVLALAAGMIKYADTPWVAAVRHRAAQALAGAPGVEEVLAVFGGQEAEPPQTYAASSGGAEDVTDRADTLFPDTVDREVYAMAFDHVLPVQGTLTSAFGARTDPVGGQEGFHYGLDLAAEEGTKIGAFADGTVRETGENAGYGNYLVIGHADGFATLYAHCSSLHVRAGQQVTRGEKVAQVGQSGKATGPHLHLELWKDGRALDPAAYLSGL